jgi:predicted ABC-type ATPase
VTDLVRAFVDLAVTPNGRPADASPLAKPGYKGGRKLSDYERMIAHALIRKGMDKHRAIAMARGLTNRAARSGRWGRGKAGAATVAGSAASVAQRASFSSAQLDVLDLAVREARYRDIDLSWNEGLHPRDWRGRFGKKNALKGPLDHNGRVIPTKSENYAYGRHVKAADTAIISNASRLATENDGVNGVTNADGSITWSKERRRLQRDIVNTVYRRQAKTALSEKKALFLGGLPGAGKSTSIKNIPGLNEKHYVTINPDIFKEELARRGHVPELAGLSPMERSAFVHEESSMMALMLAEKATRAHKNVIWDITMSSPGSVSKRIAPLHAAGYRTHGVFVDIPFAMSQTRVEQRHKGGHLAHWRDTTGQHLGQRLVPSSHVNSGKSKTGSSSANRDAFEAVKHQFAAHKLYDNSGKTPKLLESRGTFKV